MNTTPCYTDSKWVDHMLKVAHATHTVVEPPAPAPCTLWVSKTSARRCKVLSSANGWVELEFNEATAARATLSLQSFYANYKQV